MSRVLNERTILLPREEHNGVGRKPSKQDPMQLSAAHRRGILAGLWLGTFLGVSLTNYLTHIC